MSIDPLTFMSLTIILYILRMTGPFVNYIFIPFLIVFFIFTSIWYYHRDKLNFDPDLLKFQYPFLIISFFFIVGFIITSGFIFFAFKELLNVLIFIFLNISLLLFVKSKEELAGFIEKFCKQFIIISFAVGILGLTKLILQISGYDAITKLFSGFITGTSLNTDYNYYSIFSFIGLLALLFYRRVYRKSYFILIFIVLNLNILFSGSRRGIVFLLLIWLMLYFFGLNFKFELKRFALKILGSIIFVLSFGFILISVRNIYLMKERKQSADLNPVFQNKLENISDLMLSRYLTIIGINEIRAEQLYSEMWINKNYLNTVFNYNRFRQDTVDGNLIYNGKFNHGLLCWEPEATSTTHEIVQTPYGKGVRVSRFDGNDDGWSLLYAGRGNVFYSDHEYVINFKFRILKGAGIPFKIGFWSDSWFGRNGDGASLELITRDLDNGWKQGTCSYVFEKSRANIPFFLNSLKDSSIVEFADIELIKSNSTTTLPRFADNISSKPNDVNKYLILYDSTSDCFENKQNLFSNGNFGNGKKYWVPYSDSTRHELIETPYGKGIRISRTNGDGSYWSLLYDGRPIIYYANHTYRIKFNYKIEKGEALPFGIGWWVNDGNQGYISYKLPLSIKQLDFGWNEAICSYTFKKTHLGSYAFLNSLQDYTVVDICSVELTDLSRDDSLPVFVDQLKDMEQIPSDGILDSVDLRENANTFYGPRLNRWVYSKIIFQDSLSRSKKIFGGGFNYLESIGKTFGETEIDDPHNPFISAFLYSGVLGGVFYIWFMFLVVYYYIKYYRYHIFFFVSFIIVFSFSFFSANTHFSIPVFTILCIIPFLTRHIVQKELKHQQRQP